jgi:hypothetical protein
MIGSICRGCWYWPVEEPQMHAQRKVPMLVTAFVAVVGMAAILFNNVNPDTDPQADNNARAITAAAVSRAGAIEIPSEWPAG